MRSLSRALVACAFLSACGDGNPITGLEEDDSDGDVSPGSLYATDLNADLTMNALSFDDGGTPADPSDDRLFVNNLPFDGQVYARTGALANGFDRYESTGGGLEYYAIFARSASGQAEVGAVGSADYTSFGFGGALARNNSGGVQVPPAGEYTFTGEYAAIRVYDPGTTSVVDTDVVYAVTGDVRLEVDTDDFDVGGTVAGVVNNRMLYSQDGVPLGTLDEVMRLSTTDINRETGTINAIAASIDTPGENGRETLGTGEWSGIFAGPDGTEIAGIVVVEGPASLNEAEGAARETGVFMASRP